MTPPSDTQYEPMFPEVRIAHAERGDDLAGLLRIDMSREQFATLRDEIRTDLDNDEREPGSSLVIEFTAPFDDLRDALDEMLSHPQNAVKAVRLDETETDTEPPSSDEPPRADAAKPKPDTLSISIILNTEQARSLKADTIENDEADRSAISWHHDFTPRDSRIFVAQASEALRMDRPALAEALPE